MANYFTLILDTVGPSSPSLNLGGTYTANSLITATVGTGDGSTTNYEMKFWGDIDVTWAKSNGILPSNFAGGTFVEADALWIPYATSKQLKLNTPDALKNIIMKLRDSVHNESAQVTKSITLDSTLPVVTIINGKADVDVIATNTDRVTANFSFSSSENFSDFKVCIVTDSSIPQDQATTIATTNGSSNTSATGGSFVSGTNYSVVLKGSDIKAISSAEGSKVIKVFVKDLSGQWSA